MSFKLIGMFHRCFAPLLTIAVLVTIVGASISTTTSPISWDDGLRHITMARVMRQEGVDQTWSRFFFGGYFAEHPVDPWLLADVSYIPFTAFADPVALRLYSIFGIFVLLLSMWRVLQSLKLPAGWLCLLLMLTLMDSGLYVRLLLGRPFVWSTIFSLLTLDAILRRRPAAVALVLLLATLFSQLFVFPLLVVGAASLYSLLCRRVGDGVWIALATLIGVVAGILLHPHSWEYVQYLVHVFIQIPFSSRTLSLGSEMQPSMSASPAVALLGITLLLLFGGVRQGSARWSDALRIGTPLIALLVLPLLLAYVLAWMRAIDLLWPLLVVLLGHVFVLSRPFVGDLFHVRMDPVLPKVRGGTLVVVILILAFVSIPIRHAGILSKDDAERSMTHLAALQVLPDGARVLNPEWFFFPPYVAANPRLTFATGIDNTFTWKPNPEAYELLEAYFSIAARTPNPVLDIPSWLQQLIEIYPSDYLVVSRKWAERLLPKLRVTPGLTPLTQSGDLIEVFSIDATTFLQEQ